jgi:hypothetical protein
VPLSEDEQRLLEQMEQALADEDPKFVSALRGTSLRSHNRRRAVLGTVGFVAGVALLMAGVIVPLTIVSVVGFVVMLGSAYVALTYWRRVSGPAEISASRAGSSATSPRAVSARLTGRSSSGFMDRLEERWRRRRESGF